MFSCYSYTLWVIAINACVVDLLGLHLNCFSSNVGSKNNWSRLLIKDSKTLATVGSKEIGLKSVWRDCEQGIFGIAVTSADFQVGWINLSPRPLSQGCLKRKLLLLLVFCCALFLAHFVLFSVSLVTSSYGACIIISITICSLFQFCWTAFRFSA